MNVKNIRTSIAKIKIFRYGKDRFSREINEKLGRIANILTIMHRPYCKTVEINYDQILISNKYRGIFKKAITNYTEMIKKIYQSWSKEKNIIDVDFAAKKRVEIPIVKIEIKFDLNKIFNEVIVKYTSYGQTPSITYSYERILVSDRADRIGKSDS